MKRVLAVLAVASLLVVAQGGIPTDSPCEFISWLMTSAGTNIAVGAIVSLLVEYVPQWSEWGPKKKRPILFGLCLIVPFVGLAIGTQICGLSWETWWWTVLVAGGAAFVGSQMAHIRALDGGKR